MTNQQHPGTPPLEMLQQWASEYWGNPGEYLGNGEKYIATKAAQWSADQELEACCEWLAARDLGSQSVAPCLLRAGRRPKPPSLKEQALEALNQMDEPLGIVTARRASIIRRALEALPE